MMSEIGHRIAAIEQGIGMVRLDRERAVVAYDGFGGAPEFVQHNTAIVRRARMVWGAAPRRDRSFRAPPSAGRTRARCAAIVDGRAFSGAAAMDWSTRTSAAS